MNQHQMRITALILVGALVIAAAATIFGSM